MLSFIRLLTDYRNDAMYPDAIHQIYNALWLGQSLSLFLHFLATRRFLPSSKPAPSSNILVHQFDLSLLIHTLFYIIETITTSMLKLYPHMLLHHFFSLILFMNLSIDKRLYSAVTLVPFIFHQIFWLAINSDFKIELLFVYNLAFLVVGVTSFSFLQTKKVGSRLVVSGLCVGIVCVNAMIYCDSYESPRLCPREMLGVGRAASGAVIVVAGVASVAIAFVHGRLSRLEKYE